MEERFLIDAPIAYDVHCKVDDKNAVCFGNTMLNILATYFLILIFNELDHTNMAPSPIKNGDPLAPVHVKNTGAINASARNLAVKISHGYRPDYSPAVECRAGAEGARLG